MAARNPLIRGDFPLFPNLPISNKNPSLRNAGSVRSDRDGRLGEPTGKQDARMRVLCWRWMR